MLIGGATYLRSRTPWERMPIDYALKDEAAQRYEEITQAFRALVTAQRIWCVGAKRQINDWKRNAGAAWSTSRKAARIGICRPPHIRTNIEVWGIETDLLGLYFFPDRLLIWHQRRYAAVSYDALRATSNPITFTEMGQYPQDAEIVEWVWAYPNKDGSRDQRFKDNRQVPKMRYEAVSLASTNGLSIELYVSNKTAGWEFGRAFARIGAYASAGQARQQSQRASDQARWQEQQERKEQQRQKDEQQRRQQEYERQRQQKSTPPQPKTDLERAYELLFVQFGAPIEIAEAAYKTAMKRAHPDAGGTDEQARKLSWAIEAIRKNKAT